MPGLLGRQYIIGRFFALLRDPGQLTVFEWFLFFRVTQNWNRSPGGGTFLGVSFLARKKFACKVLGLEFGIVRTDQRESTLYNLVVLGTKRQHKGNWFRV